jgi:hypothetical protein
LKKEAILKHEYGWDISQQQVEAEVKRIDSSTRAPDVLAELRMALGDDPTRFALSVAKPLVLERELRGRFENDDRVHAPQRLAAEEVRRQLMTARNAGAGPPELLEVLRHSKAGQVTETDWRLKSHRGATENLDPGRPTAEISPRTPDESRASGGLYSIDGTAEVLAPPPALKDSSRQPASFSDLPGELQSVLHAQLRATGDVSAVIEMPTQFLLFLAKERSAGILKAVTLSVAKQGFDQWLANQRE